MSYLDIAEWIISTAQQARPKLRGQIEPTLNQLIKDTKRIDSQSNRILKFREIKKVGQGKYLKMY